MKTVAVILEFQSAQHYDWNSATENSLFGEEHPHYKTANDFINAVKDLHKKHSYKYRILNIIIG